MIRLKPEQLEGLALQVRRDWDDAHSSHAQRFRRIERLLTAFHNTPDGLTDRSGYRVPLINETVMGQAVRMVSAMIGEERKIRGVPIGEADAKQARRNAAFMDWAFFVNHDPTRELAKALIRRFIYGRSFLYAPWVEKHDARDRLIWEGHQLISLSADSLLHSSEPGRESIQDYEWVCMRYFETKRTLIEGIRNKEYPYLKLSQVDELSNRTARSEEQTEIGRLEDAIEGVDRDSQFPQSADDNRPVSRGTIPMLMWFGWIELGKKFHHVRIRRPLANEHLIASIELLDDLYPDMTTPRPFLETADLSAGGYYPKSAAAMIEPMEEMLTAMLRDFHKGGNLASFPPLLANREMADQIEQGKHDPSGIIVVTDPSKIQQVQVRYDPTFYQIASTAVRSDRDRTMGYTDFNNGRDINSPTAPKTASATLALLRESNQRQDFSMEMFAKDLGRWFKHLWELWSTKSDPSVVFRVTEQYPDIADGSGHAKMFEMPEERNGRYDYDLKFAPGPMEESARKEDVLAAYQFGIQNPQIMASPRAMHRLTVSMLKALGAGDIATELVEPPDTTPMQPDRENSMMLQGEVPTVKVADDHDLHIRSHYRMIEWQRNSKRPDTQAIQLAVAHIAEHNKKKSEQMVMQAAIAGAVDNLRSMDQSLQLPVAPLPVEQVLSGTVGNQMAQGAQDV